jgi:hypothetical protein
MINPLFFAKLVSTAAPISPLPAVSGRLASPESSARRRWPLDPQALPRGTRQAIFIVAAACCLTPWVSPPLALALGAMLALTHENPFARFGKKVSARGRSRSHSHPVSHRRRALGKNAARRRLATILAGVSALAVHQYRFPDVHCPFCLRNSFFGTSRSYLPLPRRRRYERVWHRDNDELANAIRVKHSREPSNGGSPVVANDVRGFNVKGIKNSDYVGLASEAALHEYYASIRSSSGRDGPGGFTAS